MPLIAKADKCQVFIDIFFRNFINFLILYILNILSAFFNLNDLEKNRLEAKQKKKALLVIIMYKLTITMHVIIYLHNLD